MYEREVMWRNEGLGEVARGFADNFVTMVGELWEEGEKGRILGLRRKY